MQIDCAGAGRRDESVLLVPSENWADAGSTTTSSLAGIPHGKHSRGIHCSLQMESLQMEPIPSAQAGLSRPTVLPSQKNRTTPATLPADFQVPIRGSRRHLYLIAAPAQTVSTFAERMDSPRVCRHRLLAIGTSPRLLVGGPDVRIINPSSAGVGR
ncbi:hypothetical protein BD310DRAFT_30292 [Dichomitus squalens]|uniref:Uncharacterized protein n=1 Tax=Dichomitus squalens TaxID=114155 RepID=A0A4Q9QDU0_9APHY|nr:hypothetical protein BD310DRAFT_30292 [Dichomitus squalens]